MRVIARFFRVQAVPSAPANLGNSDLTQTDAVREFNSDGKDLTFKSIKNYILSIVNKFYLKTPAVNASTATNGQVLTLINATTGESEWQDGGGGGGGGSNLANSDLTQTDATRIYDADNKQLLFLNLAEVGFGGEKFTTVVNDVQLGANNEIKLEARTNTALFKFYTANCSLGIATNGQVLTLIDAPNGTAEWQDVVAAGTYLNDAAAAGGGVPIGKQYTETGTGYVKTRLV